MPESYTGTEGTDAAAAGMDVLDGTEDRRDGWLAINKARDYVAQFFADAKAYTDTKFAAISLTWASITGKPSTFPPSAHTHSSLDFSGMRFGEQSGVWRSNQSLSVGGTLFADAPIINPYARNNGVSGWLALGVNGSGQFGFQMSSRRFKKHIHDWTPDRQAILAMRLVEFHYKVEFDDGTGDLDHGLIAEELHDLGLTWLVAYDSDGLPVTVKYDRIGLALLSVVQDHEARLSALEAG